MKRFKASSKAFLQELLYKCYLTKDLSNKYQSSILYCCWRMQNLVAEHNTRKQSRFVGNMHHLRIQRSKGKQPPSVTFGVRLPCKLIVVPKLVRSEALQQIVVLELKVST